MLESEAVSVVVDESRLGNAVVQMAPFEVVSGSHPADLHAGIRRFFQYQYRLRLINPDAIGIDVRIPDIALHYRVNSKVDGNAAVQGRDLLYYLPPQVIRVESMVPDGATDIRDASGASFAAIDALTFRAGHLQHHRHCADRVRRADGAARARPAGARRAEADARRPARTLDRHAARRRDAGAGRRAPASAPSAGWTDELLDRALSATRVAAAGAV